LVVAIFALAIIFGGPGTPHPMGSITDPFNSVDFSDLPQLSRFGDGVLNVNVLAGRTRIAIETNDA
jgi:hypothetical protein